MKIPLWIRLTLIILVGGGVAVALLLPNFIGACGVSPLSSVKANMHTLQTMVETYAVDWAGVYPSNIEALHQEANETNKAYWKPLKNPVSGYTGLGKAYANEGKSREEGIVTYESTGQGTLYFIYGYGNQQQRLQQKGQDFYLTNG